MKNRTKITIVAVALFIVFLGIATYRTSQDKITDGWYYTEENLTQMTDEEKIELAKGHLIERLGSSTRFVPELIYPAVIEKEHDRERAVIPVIWGEDEESYLIMLFYVNFDESVPATAGIGPRQKDGSDNIE